MVEQIFQIQFAYNIYFKQSAVPNDLLSCRSYNSVQFRYYIFVVPTPEQVIVL